MKLFDMMTDDDVKRIKEDRGSLDLTRRIEELDKSLSIALEINDRYHRENIDLKDISLRETGILIPLTFLIILFGVYPQPLIDMVSTSMNEIYLIIQVAIK